MTITDYHAHVYYDQETFPQARALCEEARDRFGIFMGTMHKRQVGPHPRWSCQLSFAPERFGEIVPWLAMHRGPTVVFIHPNTGDDLRDHSAHAMWLGPSVELDLGIFGG